MSRKPTAESHALRIFQRDTASHQMEIVRDDGVNRHIRFRNTSGEWNHWFDIITWHHALCINGDYGCFVFSRVPDMFEFFRRGANHQNSINPGYWSEKVIAQDRVGVKAFEFSQMTAEVVKRFREHWRYNQTPHDERREKWEEIRYFIESTDHNEVRAYDAAIELDPEVMVDFWEHDSNEFTTQYLWCCYAIVWGIGQYDQHKAATAATAPEVASA